jgi:hypothetical protein
MTHSQAQQPSTSSFKTTEKLGESSPPPSTTPSGAAPSNSNLGKQYHMKDATKASQTKPSADILERR